MNKEEAHIAIVLLNYTGGVNVELWNDKGNIVGNAKAYAKKNSIIRIPIMPTNPVGDYSITTMLDNGDSKSLDITITGEL